MNKWLCYGLLGAGFFLSGCQEKVEVGALWPDVNTDGRVIGSVNGVVRDEVTQVPLSGVTVSWARLNQILSATTDENGVFTITGLNQGDYDLVFRVGTAEGETPAYADAKMRVTIPSLEDVGIFDQPTDQPFEHTVDAIVPIYPLSGMITGTVITTLESPSFADPEFGAYADGASVVVNVLSNDANYWIIGDQYSATTASDGRFVVSGLPVTASASVLVQSYEANGYIYASQSLVVETNADGQTDVGGIVLYSSATPPLIVADDFIDETELAVDSSLSIEFSKLFDESSVVASLAGPSGAEDVTTAWSGAVLTVTPEQILSPGSRYSLTVEGMTLDGYNFQGAYDFTTEDGVELASTNLLDSLGNSVDDFDITAELTLNFSRPLVDGDFSLEENGFPVYVSTTINGTDAVITPMFNLEPDTSYVLTYSVESDIGGDSMAGSITFSTESDALLPAKVSDFEYLAPISVDFNTTNVSFRWASSPDAEEYHIYARDTLNNTSEVLIQTVAHRDYWAYHEVSFALPSQFDQYQSDAYQTPFSGGTEVIFNIAAANSLGEGPLLTPGQEVDVEDNVRPVVQFAVVQGSTDNTAGTAPSEVVLVVQASEYIQNPSAQYFPSSCFSCSIVATNLNQSRDGVEITLAIGVGDRLENDEIVVDFQDTSGNYLISETYSF